jgi:type IV secretion system protein VirD4
MMNSQHTFKNYAICMLIAPLFVVVGSLTYNDIMAQPNAGYLSLYTLWKPALAAKQKNITLALAGFWVCVAFLWYFFCSMFFSGKQKIFGSARFATNREVRKAGLLGETGVVVGQIGSQFVTIPATDNLIIAAGTRSGKSQGIAIPNCLNHPGSLVAVDVKNELHDYTAGFRQAHGSTVYVWSPASKDARTHRYNPLFYVTPGTPTCIDDIQKLSFMLIPASSDSKNNFFTSNARDLFVALSLLVLYLEPPENRHLPCVQRYALHPKSKDFWKDKLKFALESSIALPTTCVEILGGFFMMPGETFASIMGEYKTYTTLLNNPVTIASLSGNDFDLRRFRHDNMTIFVFIALDDRKRLQPLISLFFQQLISLNTQELPKVPGSGQLPCLLLLDEFVTLGRVDSFVTGIATLAGYNLRTMIFVQNPSQLESTYSRPDKDTFLVNCANRIVYGTKDVADAEQISKLLGSDTIKKESRTLGTSASTNSSDHARPLMLPQEITGLPMDKCLVITPHCPPFIATKIFSYKNKVLKKRFEPFPAPPIPQQKIDAWQSLDLISETLGRAVAAADQVAENTPPEIVLDLEKSGLADVGKWIEEVGGNSMSEADANALATRMLSACGAIDN